MRYSEWCTACDFAGGRPDPQHHAEWCPVFRHDGQVAEAGAYWLGMLGFALAAPAAYRLGRYHEAAAETVRWAMSDL